MNKLRLFIIECPNPMDLLAGRSESQCLEKACKLVGHDITTFQVLSKDQLVTVCNYISTIFDGNSSDGLLICIHLSGHGNEDGLSFGKDFVKWKNLFEVIQPICSVTKSRDRVVFVISACGAGKQKLTQELEAECRKNNEFIPPKYLFVIMDEKIRWDSAVVLWTVFYHQLSEVSLDDNSKEKIQVILCKIKGLRVGGIQYHRWDDNRKDYLTYIPKVYSIPRRRLKYVIPKSRLRLRKLK